MEKTLKKEYQQPLVCVITVDKEDVIRTSGTGGFGGEDDMFE